MQDVLLKYSDAEMHLGVDVKQGTVPGSGGVATITLQAKDTLRNTTFQKQQMAGASRVQGRAYTTHGDPLLQALVNTEGTDNFVDIFQCLETLHDGIVKQRPLVGRVIAVHSDYAPGIECARAIVFRKSRPVKDQFHFAEHTGLKTSAGGTLSKKMRHRQVASSSGNHELTNLGWTVAGLKSLRRIPTLDCSSALYEGFLQKLEHVLDEKDAAQYLGPNSAGPQKYTVKSTVKELREVYNLRCYCSDDAEEMYFCPNWTGVGLLTSGYEGSSVEPLHSPWEKARKDIATLSAKHSSLEILSQMQYLYENCFGKWFDWEGTSRRAPSLYPSEYDPAHLNGASLTAAGRSHAQALWAASQTREVHRVVLERPNDLPGHFNIENTQVVAVVQDLSKSMIADDAEAGASLLFSSGEELRQRLVNAGLLQQAVAKQDEKKIVLATSISRVNAVFNNLAYVIISAETQMFRACRRGPVCTCKWFCRYGGCEHVEYVAMLELRLQKTPRHGNPQVVPGTCARGRKRKASVAMPPPSTVKRSRKSRQQGPSV